MKGNIVVYNIFLKKLVKLELNINFTNYIFFSVRTYERSLEKLDNRQNITLLVAGLRKEVQNLIAEGVGLVWESYKLDPYVQRLADCVVTFQEKVDDLLIVDEEIDIDVRSLETCAYSANNFKDILAKIQKAVDDLSLRQYSNLHAWVGKLDEVCTYLIGS